MNRLDYYDIIPKGMDAYLSNHGWHFSKAMCEWAVSKMRDRSNRKVQMRTKQEIETFFKNVNVQIENDKGYDAVFVYHMAMSDFFGSSMRDEASIARYVKDVLDDVDGYDGIAFSRFIADCNGKGMPIDWEDMI